MRQFTVSSFVAFALVVAGCSSGEDQATSKQAASADSYCDTVCSSVTSCDRSLDKDVCKNDCEEATGVRFKRLRADLVENVQACVENKDCSSIIKKDVEQDCSNEELVKISPSAAAESFCEAMAAKAKECNGGEIDLASCLIVAKPYNDGSLAEAEGCFSKACGTFNACTKSSIDIYLE